MIRTEITKGRARRGPSAPGVAAWPQPFECHMGDDDQRDGRTQAIQGLDVLPARFRNARVSHAERPYTGRVDTFRVWLTCLRNDQLAG